MKSGSGVFITVPRFKEFYRVEFELIVPFKTKSRYTPRQ